MCGSFARRSGSSPEWRPRPLLRNKVRRTASTPKPGPDPKSDDNPSDPHGTAWFLSSFFLGNAGISYASPDSKVVTPIQFSRDVGRDYRQVFVSWGTYHVNWPPRFAAAQQQATMASDVLWVIFDDLATRDDLSHFLGADHTVRSIHLAYGMGQIKALLACSLPNTVHERRCRLHSD